MRLRHVWGLLFAGSLVGFSAALASRRPPTTNAERVQRIEKLYKKYAGVLSAVPSIEAEALLRRIDDPDLVLVDVRTPAEQAVSMLPRAITQEEYERRADELAGRPVVTYCTIGVRSGEYAKELLARGVEATNLQGSILAWTHAGGTLIRDGEPTRQVHVYGPTWNLAATNYQGVW